MVLVGRVALFVWMVLVGMLPMRAFIAFSASHTPWYPFPRGCPCGVTPIKILPVMVKRGDVHWMPSAVLAPITIAGDVVLALLLPMWLLDPNPSTIESDLPM